MKNVMITGASGHLGSYILENAPKDWNIYAIDNLSSERYCSLFGMLKKIRFEQKDFVDFDTSFIPSVVLHLGAITDASTSHQKKDLVWNVNVTKTIKFFDKLRLHFGQKPLIVFPSSTSVYGQGQEIMKEDENNVLPQSEYGNSKILVEKYLREQDKNINYCILRFGTIFGMSTGARFHTAINKLTWQALTNQKLTIWQENYENDMKRPYLGLGDMFQSLQLVINKSEMWNQTFNVISENHSLKDIVEHIKMRLPKTDLEFVNTPLLNQHSYVVDISKIKSFGFFPENNVFDGIDETIRLFTE